MTRLISFAALIAVAGCADSEPPDAARTDDSGAYNMIAPVTARIEAEEPTPAIGSWRRSMQDEKPALLFGPPDTEPLFSIACGENGGIGLQRHGAIAAGEGETMSIGVGDAARRLRVAPVEGPLPRLRASVPRGDDLLEKLADAAAPIRLAIGDEAPLLLKPDAEIGAFIRGCTGEAPFKAGATADGGGNQANAAAPAPAAD